MKIGHILVAWRFAEEMQLHWKCGIFGEIGKPIALPILMKIGRFWFLGDFLKRCNYIGNIGHFWHQIGKPIALLFDENWPCFGCLEIS